MKIVLILLLSLALSLYGLGQSTGFQGVGGFQGVSGFGYQSGFTLSGCGTAIAVNAGSTATCTVTVTSVNGFNSAVALTAAPGPTGVAYSFSPSSVTPPSNSTATSTLTVSASSGAPASACPGSGNFTITATSGTLNQNISPCVVVTPVTGGFTLTVSVTGAGSVSSSPSGVGCPGTCFVNYTSGTNVTLTETPGISQTFISWGGACSGTGSCVVAMTAAQSVTAAFSSIGFTAALPQAWVDNNELTCLKPANCYNGANGQSPALTVPYTAPAFEITLGSATVVGTIPAYCSLAGTYAATGAGKQAAINAVEACRTAGIAHSQAIGAYIHQPPGVYSTVSGIVIPQTSTTAATAPIILDSTSDATLAALPMPVGRGGVQDNVILATAPGLSNKDLTGGNVYYDLGPTNVSSVIAGRTQLSTTTTTLSAITLSGSNQLVNLADGFVPPGNSYIVDTGGNAETVVGVSGANQTGLYGVFTKNHASGVSVTFCATGFCSTGYALANGTMVTQSQYNYEQYLVHDTCSGTGQCVPIALCTPGVLGVSRCPVNRG